MLSPITAQQLRFIEAVLSNDEASTDKQMRKRFVKSGLTVAQATRAVQYRDLYMGRLHLDGQTPIVMDAGGPEISVSLADFE